MNRALLLAVVAILLVLGALRAAGDMDYWRRYTAALGGVKAEQGPALTLPRLRIAGELSALSRTTPEAESLLPAALEQARDEAVQRKLQALVVHRHGHRVFEYFGAGRHGDR